MTENLSAIREWARKQENLRPIGTRGRIPQDVIDAYHAAHGTTPAEEAPEPTGPTVYVERPIATPGVAESYGDDAGKVAKVYVPGARRDDLTETLIVKAREAKAAIVDVAGELKLYRDTQPPDGSQILLDFRDG
jgi:hypothetical protein